MIGFLNGEVVARDGQNIIIDVGGHPMAAGQKNIPIATYTPLQVKMAITGYGRAEKNQIGQMVKVLLKLKEIPKPDDVADALAVALTHAFTNKFTK